MLDLLKLTHKMFILSNLLYFYISILIELVCVLFNGDTFQPPVTTAVLKLELHCTGCIEKIYQIASKIKGRSDYYNLVFSYLNATITFSWLKRKIGIRIPHIHLQQALSQLNPYTILTTKTPTVCNPRDNRGKKYKV